MTRTVWIDPRSEERLSPRAQFATGIPACWTWPLPTEDDYLDAYDGSPADALEHMLCWQRDMCAVCGRLVPYNSVTDHDHETGLIRGFLCQSCNVAESQGGRPIFDRYRLVNPASVCRLERQYSKGACYEMVPGATP